MAINGVVLYRGKSKLNGKPIVVIATGLRTTSKNVKTGDMVQTWILSDSGVEPNRAVYTGEDEAICGDCPHRSRIHADGKEHRTCYVNVQQAPLAIYRAYIRGAYLDYNAREHNRLFRGRAIRFGSYGDPTAAPRGLWARLAKLARKRTGYTHQWKRFPSFSRLVMASVDSAVQAAEAQAAGWRTFRVKQASVAAMPTEIACPASIEAGKRRTCETCSACSGAGNGRSVVINAHGAAKNFVALPMI